MGGGSDPLDTQHGKWIGGWGNLGSQPQKGIITYALSANRQRPMAGVTNAMIFNTYRRCRAQFLYVVPPIAFAYLLLNWATEKNEYYNSKEGRMHSPEAAAEAVQGGPRRQLLGHTSIALDPRKKLPHSSKKAPSISSFPSPAPSTTTSTTARMSKEKPSTESEALRKQEKKAKKEKKEKRSETDGVKKSKKDKKDSSSKKERKEKKKDDYEPAIGDEVSTTTATAPKYKPVTVEEEDGNGDVEMTTTAPLLNALEEQTHGPGLVKDEKGDSDIKPKEKPLLGALVPFAVPLADDKVGKKVLKGVKKAAQNKTLKRGVKEVVKALRKSPTTPTSSLPNSVVVIAADISPMDVISHLPVLCEDHGVPYIFVPSRAELGAAGSTKRPTSVVMIGKEKGRKKEAEEGKKEDEEDWGEVYAELVKVVQKAGRNVRV